MTTEYEEYMRQKTYDRLQREHMEELLWMEENDKRIKKWKKEDKERRKKEGKLKWYEFW